ncbi:MAG: hypothetical protein M9949_01745 [Candidatus Kapabacteria bacterium]|nr:hypothetical protein [Candidatus Kapabacteria bacterium]
MIEIEFDGKKLQYLFKNLCVEQSELAKEIGLYRELQLESEPPTLDEWVRSGGAEWKMKICRYIFNLEGKKYDRGYAETELYQTIRYLNTEATPKLEEAVKDFFINSGSEQKLSQLFRTGRNKNEMLEYLKLAMMMNKQGLPNKSTSD